MEKNTHKKKKKKPFVPSAAELSSRRVSKYRTGPLPSYDRFVAGKVSTAFTRYFISQDIKPGTVRIFAAILFLSGCAFFLRGDMNSFLRGVILLNLWYIVDLSADESAAHAGEDESALLYEKTSLQLLFYPAFFICLTIGVCLQFPETLVLIAGMVSSSFAALFALVTNHLEMLCAMRVFEKNAAERNLLELKLKKHKTEEKPGKIFFLFRDDAFPSCMGRFPNLLLILTLAVLLDLFLGYFIIFGHELGFTSIFLVFSGLFYFLMTLFRVLLILIAREGRPIDIIYRKILSIQEPCHNKENPETFEADKEKEKETNREKPCEC